MRWHPNILFRWCLSRFTCEATFRKKTRAKELLGEGKLERGLCVQVTLPSSTVGRLWVWELQQAAAASWDPDNHKVLFIISGFGVQFHKGMQSKQALFFSCSVVSDSLWPHGLQNTRFPCPSLFPGVRSNSCPLRQWSHPTISSSVSPFSSRWLEIYLFGLYLNNCLCENPSLVPVDFWANRSEFAVYK